MRIAHFGLGRCNPDSANGVDKAVYHLSRAQAALGNAVAVFQLTTKEPIPIPGVEVRVYPPAAPAFRLPGRLLADLGQWRPDVVHMHSVFAPANASLALWLRRRSLPYALTIHGSLSPEVLRRKRLLKLAYRWLFAVPTLNGAAFLHALSEHHGLREYGARVPVVVAPNGIDPATLPARPKAGLLLSRYPQVRGKPVFLFIGRMDIVYKGLDVLLQGLALASLPEASLVLVGPATRRQRRSLAALARRLGIEGQVIFNGAEFGPAKFDLLAGADVFVLCSRTEGMPLAVLEAAASGKACLVSPAANPAGLIERRNAGIEVQLTPGSIAAGLRRFAGASAPELRAMGRHARRMATGEFRWETTARLLGEAYDAHVRRPGS
jgi:glycosyltransferase involved in cell wall biosynthesis